MKKTVLAFGEVLWDILPTATVLGGAPFNFTYRINSLGNSGLMISRLGKDDLGEKAFRQIGALGMPQNFIQWDATFTTGTVEVSFDAQNNPRYRIVPDVAYDYIEVTDQLLKTVTSAECICFGTLAQRSSKSKSSLKQIISHSEKAIKFFDINLRSNCFSPETIKYSLKMSNILKLNQDEAIYLGKLFAYKTNDLLSLCNKIIGEWLLDYCIITLDKMGALVVSSKGKIIYEPGYAVQLTDSIGAGDAFSAGFVHKYLQKASLKEACSFANKLGAKVATQKGGTVPIEISELVYFDQGMNNRIIKPELKEYIQ